MKSSVFCLMISGAVLGLLFAIDDVVIIDLNVISPKEFPSEEFWRSHFALLEPEICDGERDYVSLNESFLGGWNMCIEFFALENDLLPWDYSVASREYPLLLSRNFSCTDNIAGQLGWQRATEQLKATLATTTEDQIRRQIYYVNRRVFWSVIGGAAFLSICLYWDLRGYVSKWRKQKSRNSC